VDYQPDPNRVRPRHYPRWLAKRVRDWTASILPYQRFNVTRLTWQYLPAHPAVSMAFRCTGVFSPKLP
jgi:hypothetical protein